MSKRVELLEGNIAVSLTKLAIPIMATSLIQMAYNLVDMIWLGRVGSGAVAAVGAAGMYGWLSQSLTMLASTGGKVRVSQSLGAEDAPLAGKYAKNAIQLGAILSIIYGLIALIFNAPLIDYFKLTDIQTIWDARQYLMITCGLIVISSLDMILISLITATGNSRTPFLVSTVGLVANIILDPVFIFGFGPIPKLGVAGAAIATVIGQAIVLILLLYYASHDFHLFIHVKIKEKPDLPIVREIAKIGIPTAIQNLIFTGITMVISRFIASWGDAAIAVQKVGSQIESLAWMTAEGFAAAIGTFVGQNYGAGNFERAKKGYKTAIMVVSVWGLFVTCLLVFAAEPMFKIFINESAVLPLGIDYLIILGFSQMPMCIDIVTAGAFGGFSKTLPPAIASIILTGARIPMAMILSATALGLNGVWWSISISSISKGVVLFVMFEIFLRMRSKKIKQQKQEQIEAK